MSGGIAYVLPKDREAFKSLCNLEMIELEDIDDQTDGANLWERILNHFIYTGSTKAGYVLENWEKMDEKFVKVIPKDYKRMMKSIEEQKQAGLTEEEATMRAFETNVAHRGRDGN